MPVGFLSPLIDSLMLVYGKFISHGEWFHQMNVDRDAKKLFLMKTPDICSLLDISVKFTEAGRIGTFYST